MTEFGVAAWELRWVIIAVLFLLGVGVLTDR